MKKPDDPFLISVAIAALLLLILIAPPVGAAENATAKAPQAASAPAPAKTPAASAPADIAQPAAATGATPANMATPPATAKKGKAALDAPPGPGDIYLRQVTLDEAAQLIARIGKTSIVVTESVSNKVVSLYLRDVNVEGMIKNLCRAAGIWYRFDSKNNTYVLMSGREYQQDIAITRDDITRTWVLRHHNVISIANAIQALFGARVSLIEPVEEMPETDMGSTSRSSTGSSGSYSSSRNSRNSRSASTRSYSGSRSARSGAGGMEADPRQAITGITQYALESTLEPAPEPVPAENTAGTAQGSPVNQAARIDQFSSGALLAASRQGAPINITYNLLHNLLLVRSSDEAALADIETLIQKMDRPPRQVLLEMKILEVQLGSDFSSVFDIGASRNGTSSGPLSPTSADSGVFPSNSALLGNFPLGSGTVIWQRVSSNLRMRLELMEKENRVNTLATPTLLAANNQEAQLFVGTEEVLVTGASADNTTGISGVFYSTFTVNTEQRNVGRTLIILPRINDDRSVTLTIDLDNSSINRNARTLPIGGGFGDIPIDTVSTANLQVTAHAYDGMTVAVGGMISQNISDNEEKVPLLGDIPLLGHLFKKTGRGNSRSQLVLLITPWVLENPAESDALARKKEEELRQLDRADASRGHLSQGKTPPRDSVLDPLPENAPNWFGSALSTPERTPNSPPENF
ncbi:MAG: hypothetical protein LBQ81_09575 [Zoogloeaceae bacterium]|jgi:general secretion pathway protein D|nr:hypothetical protein [Zoogloeaceae bacterium]